MEVSLQTKFKDAISALHFHLIWKPCSAAAVGSILSSVGAQKEMEEQTYGKTCVTVAQ